MIECPLHICLMIMRGKQNGILKKKCGSLTPPPKPEDEQRLIPPSRSQGPWNRLTKKLQPIATPVYLNERRATQSRPAEAYILCANKQYVVGLTERPSCKSVGLLCNCSQPDSRRADSYLVYASRAQSRQHFPSDLIVPLYHS